MKTTCEFRFGFWDVTARGDAHFAVSQNQDYARIEDINAEDPIVFPNVATLEPDFGFPLDGSKEWLPDNARLTQWGWWSTDLSGRRPDLFQPAHADRHVLQRGRHADTAQQCRYYVHIRCHAA